MGPVQRIVLRFYGTIEPHTEDPMRTLFLFPLAALLACSSDKTGPPGGIGDEIGTGTPDDTGTSTPDDTGAGVPEVFTLGSDSFLDGASIPLKHVCTTHGGDNISPELHWEHAPEAGYFSIIMDDEVSPCGTGDAACRHWALFNIPASTGTLPEALDPATVGGLAVGSNYSGSSSYAGPCPPNAHVYKITIYALSDAMPVIASGAAYTRSQFESEFTALILAQDTFQGTFDPSR